MSAQVYDLAIIGGGINGAGIAADAAGRGLSVVLVENGDLGGATSSASSKLIHGGLRYLESGEIRLVREALREREVLLAKAPHIIWPLRFVLPHGRGMRARPLIRAGLFLYDHLAERQRIPASRGIDLRLDPAGAPLAEKFRHGYSYWDCWVDDARLVVLNARAAAQHGAVIETRSRLTEARQESGLWHLTCQSGSSVRKIACKSVVNAAGPWVDGVMAILGAASGPALPRARLVKGSHIVVPRITGAEDAYILPNEDGRVVFILPFEERFSLIGTTDVAFEDDARDVAISREEEDYLLAAANRFLRRGLQREDIRWRFSGVRPLYDDGSTSPSSVSRDYRLVLDAGEGRAPVVHVLGGKVTTYRRLAEAALGKLAPYFPDMGPPCTADPPLPGGDVGERGIGGYAMDLLRRYPALPPRLLFRLLRRYGTDACGILGDAREIGDLGDMMGGGLSAREVAFLKANEWARDPDDVLWRRTKTGLHMTDEERERARERIAQLL